MTSTVTVLCPNGRRVPIKASPTTTLMQVLEQACSKQKLDPKFHALKHHTKLLDLNSLFRYSNLSQNAKLEMVTIDRPRAEVTNVVLAVQCEDGSRVQGNFDPTSTHLWGVLTKLGVVSEEGVGRFEPVVVYMNNQICGEVSLRQKTLRELGLASGRSVVRLLFRERQSEPSSEVDQPQEVPSQDQGKNDSECRDVPMEEESIATTQEPLESEHKSVEMRTDSDDEQPRSKLKDPVTRKRPAARVTHGSDTHTVDTAIATGVPFEDESDLPYFPAHPISIFPQDEPIARQTEPQQQPSPSEQLPVVLQTTTTHVPTLHVQPFRFPEIALAQADTQLQSNQQNRPQQQPVRFYDEPCDRETVVYHLDNSLPVTPTQELPDEFFSVTVQDVHLMYSDLKKQTKSSDTPLLTQEMRKMLKGRRYEHYNVAVIRIHFPDQWILQGCFRPNESLKAVVKFVREHLADPQLKFHLYTAPPKNILRSGRVTLAEAGFVPAAILHLGLDSPNDLQSPLLSYKTLESAQSALQAEMVMFQKRDQKSPQETHNISSSAAAVSRTGPSTTLPQSNTSSATGVPAASGRGAAVGGGGPRKVPKWFKVGK